MAKLKDETPMLLDMATCLATDDASDGDSSDESHESERSVCASTGSMKGIIKHSTDAGAGLGANALRMLSKLRWPKFNNGPKCLTDCQLETTSVMNSGVVLNYNVGLQLSKATNIHEELTELLTQYAKLSNPNLTFSSIQVCRNVHPKLHVVPRNTGPSGLVTFGDYGGGKFWTWDGARGDVNIKVAEPIRNRPETSVGNVIPGTHLTQFACIVPRATNHA